jgi:hypothetical protein
MKQNEYNAAEAVEIGKAEDVILGGKTIIRAPDFSGGEPLEFWYEF